MLVYLMKPQDADEKAYRQSQVLHANSTINDS